MKILTWSSLTFCVFQICFIIIISSSSSLSWWAWAWVEIKRKYNIKKRKWASEATRQQRRRRWQTNNFKEWRKASKLKNVVDTSNTHHIFKYFWTCYIFLFSLLLYTFVFYFNSTDFVLFFSTKHLLHYLSLFFYYCS